MEIPPLQLVLPVPPAIPEAQQYTAQVATAAAAAAAPPPPPKQGSNHPPYAEMIVTAIKSLNEKKGSSKTAIAKFIDSTFSNLPQSHSALLSHHLKRLKKKGAVLMVKHSYKLPKEAFSSSSPTMVKRGRGRPPKPREPSTDPSTIPTPASKPVVVDALVPSSSSSPPLKRGRGRPPKQQQLKINSNGAVHGVVKGPSNGLSPRPRGRPRKDTSALGGGATRVAVAPAPMAIVVAKEGMAQAAVVPPVVVKRGRPRGPPKVRVPTTGSGKPRGRPRKVKIADGNGIGVSIGGGGSVISGGGVVLVSGIRRGRGRPPKVSGGIVKPKKVSSTGRPVGRPRKVTTAIGVGVGVGVGVEGVAATHE